MTTSEEDVRHSFSLMGTDELLDRLGSGRLTEAAQAIALAELKARGVDPNDPGSIEHSDDADTKNDEAAGIMTSEQFNALVSRLEDEARKDPESYQAKVLRLALLGNAYIGAVVLLITGVLAGLITLLTVFPALVIKLIAFVGAFLWITVRAIWIKVPPPKGAEVWQQDAPELFALIEELRAQLDAPRFHHVLITNDFNAAVVQSPRLGIFGWPSNYLLIGLPLLKSLTVEQFKAVLAHEFGHLARDHGRMSNWIYRQRLRWSRLVSVLEATEGKGGFLFRRFLNWFAPYFNAYSFPLARANEYEADATSARLTSPETAAQALTSVNVIANYLGERFWPQVHAQADDQPQPAYAPYSGMAHRVATELDDASVQTWLEQAMARQMTSGDTHPALRDRLLAIGASARLVPPEPDDAADQLLGTALADITDSFDRLWKDGIQPAWEERHKKVQEARRRLAELNTQHESGAGLTVQEAFERASLTESVGGNTDAALAQFRALHQRVPDDAVVCMSLGARLLAGNDDAGRVMVERAMELDEDAICRGCELLREYCWRSGREEEARAWHQRLLERAQLEEAAAKERRGISEHDNFEQHGLPEDVLDRLREELRTVPHLEKAYLVRKCLKYLAHRPCFVFGFTAEGRFGFYSKRHAAGVRQAIKQAVHFPGETFMANVEGEDWRLRLGQEIKTVEGARIL